MAQSGSNPVGVDNTFRRKFNREEYLERAREREQQEEEARSKPKGKAPPIQRKPLKHRDYEVDLESRLGKTQVVTPIAPLSQQAGYYCSVCECVVKDSANYLDHINGKKHQRALGMSMRVERASLQQMLPSIFMVALVSPRFLLLSVYMWLLSCYLHSLVLHRSIQATLHILWCKIGSINLRSRK
ncbi:zinc finger matrin-type protein 2 isoform X2 [Phalaenopsis equestris]|uniref:zinc finger matrin-type protein 2 isoform X2 n=1 Tax=Phalaenopsis equestris TaxID=78828 RepID=UPI0009E487F5|nr:zinc finger matrin-type protein 2 isoform X2 [Phalaenopsis equestris]